MLGGAPLELLIPLPSDAACQLDILGHYGDPFGVDGAKGIPMDGLAVPVQLPGACCLKYIVHSIPIMIPHPIAA